MAAPAKSHRERHPHVGYLCLSDGEHRELQRLSRMTGVSYSSILRSAFRSAVFGEAPLWNCGEKKKT